MECADGFTYLELVLSCMFQGRLLDPRHVDGEKLIKLLTVAINTIFDLRYQHRTGSDHAPLLEIGR